MTELIVGKYKFYPYEYEKCKEPTLRDIEDLLRRFNVEKRSVGVKKQDRPQRRDHDAPPADHSAA